MALCIVAVDYLSYSEKSEQSWKKNVFIWLCKSEFKQCVQWRKLIGAILLFIFPQFFFLLVVSEQKISNSIYYWYG